jgi:hypothetical protein
LVTTIFAIVRLLFFKALHTGYRGRETGFDISGENFMRFLILIYSNPQSRHVWNQFTEEQRAQGWRRHFDLVNDLERSGELVLVEGLAETTRSKVVSRSQGRTIATDGPFAESKEYLAGFFIVDCDTIERAIEHAGRIPEAEAGLVEVRPILPRATE